MAALAKTDYEKEWPTLRVQWAKDKIDKWRRELQNEAADAARRHTLEDDISKMERALKDWEAALHA